MVDGPAGSVDPQEGRSLVQLQSLLVLSIGKLFAYAQSKNYVLTLAEGFVQEVRKTREGLWVQDGVHMPSSLHYLRLAQDLNLWVDGELITHGSHLAWQDLGDFWENLDPSCAWGGHFTSHDACHFSIAFKGRK